MIVRQPWRAVCSKTTVRARAGLSARLARHHSWFTIRRLRQDPPSRRPSPPLPSHRRSPSRHPSRHLLVGWKSWQTSPNCFLRDLETVALGCLLDRIKTWCGPVRPAIVGHYRRRSRTRRTRITTENTPATTPRAHAGTISSVGRGVVVLLLLVVGLVLVAVVSVVLVVLVVE